MIKYEHIKLKYDGKEILTDFNLDINESEKVLIYGKSGIGKTSLFKLLLGFIEPINGKVYYYNNVITPDIAWEIRKKVTYIPQSLDMGDIIIKDFMDDIFNIKVNKDIEIDKEKLNSLLEYFELDEEKLYKSMSQVSGGEKRRILLIIGILLKRNIYLLDEITSDLDFHLKNKVIDYFTNNQNQSTVMIISHDKEWIESNRVRLINMEKKVYGRN